MWARGQEQERNKTFSCATNRGDKPHKNSPKPTKGRGCVWLLCSAVTACTGPFAETLPASCCPWRKPSVRMETWSAPRQCTSSSQSTCNQKHSFTLLPLGKAKVQCFLQLLVVSPSHCLAQPYLPAAASQHPKAPPSPPHPPLHHSPAGTCYDARPSSRDKSVLRCMLPLRLVFSWLKVNCTK